MKSKESKTTKPLTSLVEPPLLKDKVFQAKVNEFLKGLEIEQDLIKLRRDRGISQSQLAKILGVSQPLIARLESGVLTNIELKTLARIVLALNGTLKIQVKKAASAQAAGHR